MFKSLGLLIHKTAWWRLLLGGVALGALLLWLALPASVEASRWIGTATTPEQKIAIEEEIMSASVDDYWDFVMGMGGVFEYGSLMPEGRKQREVLKRPVEQARQQRLSARQGGTRNARLSAMDARIESVRGVQAQAQQARQQIESEKETALRDLREKGQDIRATAQAFDKKLQDARKHEAELQADLDKELKTREQVAADPSLLSTELMSSIHRTVISKNRRMGEIVVWGMVYVLLFLMLLATKWMIYRSQRALLALAAVKDEEARVITMQRQMTEARLQTLQAQVEPHYLYNTLANVQALIEVDPPAANQLLGSLIDYLRAALPKMRESTSTVGQELERVRAYLAILKMRMGQRLEFEIQVPDELLPLPLPPLMLPTLVENAIKHGLEPKREGGRIEVRVWRELSDGQDRLLLQVSDTGAGLSGQEVQAGSGVGLSNLRERLRTLYGEDARFTLDANEPCGVVARLEIRVQALAAAAASAAAANDPNKVEAPSRVPSLQPEPTGVSSNKLGTWLAMMWRNFLVVLPLMIPAGYLVYLFPLLSPLIPIGLVIYWLSRKIRRQSVTAKHHTNKQP